MSNAQAIAASAGIAPGTVIAGKYRVVRVLGQGGMGVVVEALHEALDQRVAIKCLRPEALADPEVVARFLHEARAAVKLKSEHVTRVLDVGKLEGGPPFMVMEYLDGTDLDGMMQQRGALPVAEAIDYVLQALDAIAEAHVAGIVHRDLKPANLFVGTRNDGSSLVKVLDFGISKNTGDTAAHALTHTRSMIGSPLYMSPEQVRSAKRVDARSDLWSLGVIMYELLSGEVPFNGESVGGVFAAILQDDPVPLVQKRSDLPAELAAAVMKCLERDPSKRFAGAADLARARAVRIGADA